MIKKTFVKIGLVGSWKNKKGNKILIYKFKLDGTRRIFFAPEYNGNRLNSTMFVKKYDAVSFAVKFIDSL